MTPVPWCAGCSSFFSHQVQAACVGTTGCCYACLGGCLCGTAATPVCAPSNHAQAGLCADMRALYVAAGYCADGAGLSAEGSSVQGV